MGGLVIGLIFAVISWLILFWIIRSAIDGSGLKNRVDQLNQDLFNMKNETARELAEIRRLLEDKKKGNHIDHEV